MNTRNTIGKGGGGNDNNGNSGGGGDGFCEVAATLVFMM
jgi:hypothetical protein